MSDSLEEALQRVAELEGRADAQSEVLEAHFTAEASFQEELRSDMAELKRMMKDLVAAVDWLIRAEKAGN